MVRPVYLECPTRWQGFLEKTGSEKRVRVGAGECFFGLLIVLYLVRSLDRSRSDEHDSGSMHRCVPNIPRARATNASKEQGQSYQWLCSSTTVSCS